ncbi:ATP-binding protein [Chitinibacteraceae bacterium HSL-7]
MSNIIKISDEEAIHWCMCQEDDFFDRKSSRIKPVQIQDTAVAFANAEGGVIIVGIEDVDKVEEVLGRWVGKGKIEDYNQIIAALAALNPSIDFKHSFLYRGSGYGSDYILKLDIRKSLKVHETSKGDVLIRKGAQSLLVKGAKIQELMRAKGVTSEEDIFQKNISPEKIVEGGNLKSFLASLPITNKDPLDFALQENLIDGDSFAPSVASILLFADNPSSILPRQCAIRIVRYDSSHEEIERDNLTADRHIIEGTFSAANQTSL